jgi:hypothetical protein
MLDPIDKYKLEYVETTNLRRHYSSVRSGLSTFCMTVSLASLASYFSQPSRPLFLVFVGVFMLLAALVACLVLSYRCERANIYLRELWWWFEGTSKSPPGRFDDFSPANRRDLIRQMLLDEMNWVMFVALLAIGGALCKLA